MITAIQTASKLDWDGWLRGIFSALISGGAGAVAAGFGSVILDPNKDFSTGPHGIRHLFELMAFCFAFSGVISLANFLHTNPIPTVVVQSPGAGDVNVTVHQEEKK